MSSVWVTKRKGKRGVRYLVRWIEPGSGKNLSKTFKRLEDARKYFSKVQSDIENNDYFTPVKISYKKWVEQHLDNMRNSPDIDVSPKTIAVHKEALDALKEICKPKSPIDITPKMIRRYRQGELKKGLRPNTINKRIRSIRSALSYAVRDEIIPNNKLIGPHRLLLRADSERGRILEIGEVTALMKAATDIRHKAALSLAFYCALRRGEISNLEWPGVNLEDMCLTVKAGAEHGKRKNRQAHTVALRQETADLLNQMYKDRVNNYVFTYPSAFYWEIAVWFARLVKIAKIDHCSIHDLRRTVNTVLLDGGFSREVTVQLLGQKSAQVNQDYYTGMLKKQQRTAVDSLPSVG